MNLNGIKPLSVKHLWMKKLMGHVQKSDLWRPRLGDDLFSTDIGSGLFEFLFASVSCRCLGLGTLTAAEAI